MAKQVYEPTADREGYYLEGPGGGMFEYNGRTLYPNSRFNTMEEADEVGVLVNAGYKAGYEQAQKDIRKALGIKA